MSDRLPAIAADLRVIRRELEWQLALALAGVVPEPGVLARVFAKLTDILEELEQLEEAGPPRWEPGGRGRDER